MKIRSCEFELGAVRPLQWPEDGLPEFAFLGRSNVGKSSLLNRLLNRKSLARVSANPGKTREINFYRINDSFRFADLPGYGYAQVSKEQRAQFLKMMDTYLSQRVPLVRVFHLVDIRHSPSKDDVLRHQWLLSLERPVVVIATKADKLSKSKVQQAVRRIQTDLATPCQVLPVSAVHGYGIDQVWGAIQDVVVPEASPDSSSKS